MIVNIEANIEFDNLDLLADRELVEAIKNSKIPNEYDKVLILDFTTEHNLLYNHIMNSAIGIDSELCNRFIKYMIEYITLEGIMNENDVEAYAYIAELFFRINTNSDTIPMAVYDLFSYGGLEETMLLHNILFEIVKKMRKLWYILRVPYSWTGYKLAILIKEE